MDHDRQEIRWNGWGLTGHPDTLAARAPLWRWLAEQFAMPALLATPPRDLADSALPAPRLPPAHRAGLAALLGAAQLRDDAPERARHTRGRSARDLLALRAGDLSRAPDAVLYPRGEDDVLAVLDYCAKHRIALVPYGGGTGMAGGVTPMRGDFEAIVTLDMALMDRLTSVDILSGLVTAEAGIRGPVLERQLATHGLALAHKAPCCEFSTLGGWIAHSGRSRDDDVESVRLATPKGLLLPGPGVDPVLWVRGSDGTLGVVTAATLRVRAAPPFRANPAWLFRDFAGGLAMVRAAAREGVPHDMLRLSDADATRLARAFDTLGQRSAGDALADFYVRARGFDGNAALLIAGLAGSEKEMAQARRRLGALAKRMGAIALGEGPGRRWRRDCPEAPYRRDGLLARGTGTDTLETAASWSKLPALYAAVRAALDQAMRTEAPRPGARGMVTADITHVSPSGAGLSFTILYPRKLDAEIAQAEAIRQAGMTAIIAQGGTIADGIGEDNLPWTVSQKSTPGMAALAAVKHSLDPEGILNPGKRIAPA